MFFESKILNAIETMMESSNVCDEPRARLDNLEIPSHRPANFKEPPKELKTFKIWTLQMMSRDRSPLWPFSQA